MIIQSMTQLLIQPDSIFGRIFFALLLAGLVAHFAGMVLQFVKPKNKMENI